MTPARAAFDYDAPEVATAEPEVAFGVEAGDTDELRDVDLAEDEDDDEAEDDELAELPALVFDAALSDEPDDPAERAVLELGEPAATEPGE